MPSLKPTKPFKGNEYYIQGILKNDLKVVTEMYNYIFPIFKSYLQKNGGSSEQAEDIFQTILLNIIARIKTSSFNTEAPLDAYILKACRNKWFKELKRNAKMRVTNEPDLELQGVEGIAAEAVESEKWDLFNAKLKLMSENCQKILGLFFQGRKGTEIKEELDYASETVVRQRIFKCKKKLTQLIQSDSSYKELSQK